MDRNEKELLSTVMREKKAALDRASIEYERYGRARDFMRLSGQARPTGKGTVIL